MATSSGARLQRKAARTAVSMTSAHPLRRRYGIQFTNRPRDIHYFGHIFDRVCHENGIKHRLTKVKHPWTNGQRTIQVQGPRGSAW